MAEITLGDVLDRGWTKLMVDRLLGQPDRTKSGRNNIIRLYSEDRVFAVSSPTNSRRPLRRGDAPDSARRQCDLLAATFAVNRAAKHGRDTAQGRYRAGMYALATVAKERKEVLYNLKDRGICAALQCRRIVATELHGGLCLYEGEGYSFHSTLVPKGIELPEYENDKPLHIDAKPQAREPRQIDAIFTLEELPIDYSLFDVLAAPAFPQRVVTCWNCGQDGHLAGTATTPPVATMNSLTSRDLIRRHFLERANHANRIRNGRANEL